MLAQMEPCSLVLVSSVTPFKDFCSKLLKIKKSGTIQNPYAIVHLKKTQMLITRIGTSGCGDTMLTIMHFDSFLVLIILHFLL